MSENDIYNECLRMYFNVTLGTIKLKDDYCVEKCLFTSQINARRNKYTCLIIVDYHTYVHIIMLDVYINVLEVDTREILSTVAKLVPYLGNKR